MTEHLSKPPKDWLPPPRQPDDAPAYIEVSYSGIHALRSSVEFLNVIASRPSYRY